MDKRHETIIITTEDRDKLAVSAVIFLVIVAFKWLLVGYWLGSRRNCRECDH